MVVAAHDTMLVGASFTGNLRGPAILRRTDKEFIPAILRGLKTPDGRTALKQSLVTTRDDNQVLKLFLPVHQVFHVALVQAFCDTFGYPRLDTTKIDSSGLVLRRVSATKGVMERWSKQDDQIVGWVKCSDDDLDPDPAHRPPSHVTSGNREIDRHLTLPVSPYNVYSESVAPLFPAPPDVCAAAKATLLYGLVPVTSREKSENAPAPSFDPDIVRQHLPYFLVPSGSRTIPRANETLTGGDASDAALTPLLTTLRQLSGEFDMFGDSAQGKALFDGLNKLSVTDANGHRMSGLSDFLKHATDVLVKQSGGSVAMPAQWPSVSQSTGAAIVMLAQKALEARLATLLSGETRYEDPTSRYSLRAFARVKRPDGCPPELIWTEYSEPFTIASWYDSSGLPPVKIQLPKIDSAFLKNLKPNVAFSMPEDLFNTLQKDATKTLQGQDSAGGGSSLGLGWLCSFNLPIITICAFIVLNIFLGLFDLFFSWMAFIKICIPIPVPKKNG